MELLPEEVSKEEVVQRVRYFFNTQYEKIYLRSGDWGEIPSQTLDITGIKGSNKGNSTEERRINDNEYRRAKQAIHFAIAGCSHDSQIILNNYLKGEDERVTVVDLCKRLACERDKYYSLEKKACWQFSYAIDAGRQMFNVSEEVIENFHKKPTKCRHSTDISPTLNR